MFLRLVLIVFVVLTSALIPPDRGDLASYAVVAAYTAWIFVLGWKVRRGGTWPVQHLWPAVFVDVAAISALAVLAGTTSGNDSWTSEVLLRGFFVIPVIAALQQRWRLCIAACVPAIATYFTVSVITREANGEPWASVLLRTVVLTGLAAGCTLLAGVQASRVEAISTLAAERDDLLSQLVLIEQYDWSDDWRTSADPALFNAARELLTNVVKHAHARHDEVRLGLVNGTARLTVTDDGAGIPAGRLEQQLADGHIGVASHRVRLAALGGGISLRAAELGGTAAEVWLPATIRR